MQPVELMDSQRGRIVRVVMRNGRAYCGRLVAFDEDVNMLFERLEVVGEGGSREPVGSAIINGDTVAIIQATQAP